MILQWMIMPSCGSVDAVWGVVVTALAAGVLGSSAKVSSKNRKGGDHSQTHVICVYVDPFWDDNEMLRVLRGLREHWHQRRAQIQSRRRHAAQHLQG